MKYAFSELLARATMEAGGNESVENITKELLHYDILRAISDGNVAREVTLQGGSALRLVYGGQRFSEDLDFVIGAGAKKDFVIDDVNQIMKDLVMDRYGLNVEVKAPKKDLGDDVGVKKWEYRISIPGFSKKQVVKVEFCNVPSHDPEVKIIQPRYSFLGDDYAMMMRVESRREIMADKVKAIINRRFIKGRDLWDLKSLSDQGVALDMGLVMQKFIDYHNTNVDGDLAASLERLTSEDAPQVFMSEMERFLSRKLIKGLHLTDPPGIDFVRFAITQLREVALHLKKEPMLAEVGGPGMGR